MGCRNSRATSTENSTVNVKDAKQGNNGKEKVDLKKNNVEASRAKTHPTEESKQVAPAATNQAKAQNEEKKAPAKAQNEQQADKTAAPAIVNPLKQEEKEVRLEQTKEAPAQAAKDTTQPSGKLPENPHPAPKQEAPKSTCNSCRKSMT